MTSNDQAMKSITPYPEINQLLSFFTSRIASIFRTNLKGIYLTGSLSYNAFNYNSSDIDITVMLNRPISTEELKVIAQFHQQLEHKFKVWSKRLDVYLYSRRYVFKNQTTISTQTLVLGW